MGKLKRLRPESESSSSDDSDIAIEGNSDTVAAQEPKVKSKWKNRERVMVFCSRGASYRVRHLMKDLRCLMPHTKSENKLDKQIKLTMINEIAEIANCTKCLYFENRKQTDVYMWMSNIVDGPSMKFLVHNVHTMDELRMSGNCLKASRPILSFDAAFDEKPHLSIIKQLIKQTFATPDHHPRSQPFIDHVFTFSLTPDGKIWFRNFQIVDETLQLQEIGPRLVLELIRVFEGSFEGAVLYDNPNYVSPNAARRELKKNTADKYSMKKHEKMARVEKEAELATVPKPDPVGEIFNTDQPVEAPKAKLLKKIIEKKRLKRRKKSRKSGAEAESTDD